MLQCPGLIICVLLAIEFWLMQCLHYCDVIIGAVVSQITSLTIIYSTVYSDADQRKHQSSASLAFVCGDFTGTGEFPAQMASHAGNVSIWWQYNCRDVCKISLWSVEYILYQSTPNFGRISNSIEILLMGRALGLHVSAICTIHGLEQGR